MLFLKGGHWTSPLVHWDWGSGVVGLTAALKGCVGAGEQVPFRVLELLLGGCKDGQQQVGTKQCLVWRHPAGQPWLWLRGTVPPISKPSTGDHL